MAIRRVCDRCRHSRDAHTFSQRRDFFERRTDVRSDADVSVREVVHDGAGTVLFEIVEVVERCRYRDGGGDPCRYGCEMYVDDTDVEVP